MDQFLDRFAREGSMKLRDFIRALNAGGFNMWRSEVVASLSRRGFSLSDVGGQTWIVGLSPKAECGPLRKFIDENTIRADGLSCKLAAIVRGSGLPRTQVIAQLESWGFNILTVNGTAMVRGLGLKEVYVEYLHQNT